MRDQMNISHKLHPARQQGKSLAGMILIKYCLAANRKLYIGASDVDMLHDRVKLLYPDAELKKCNGYLLVEVR